MVPLLQKEAKERMLAGTAPDPGANLHQGKSCELAGKEYGCLSQKRCIRQEGHRERNS